jgi:hypothetical protein
MSCKLNERAVVSDDLVLIMLEGARRLLFAVVCGQWEANAPPNRPCLVTLVSCAASHITSSLTASFDDYNKSQKPLRNQQEIAKDPGEVKGQAKGEVASQPAVYRGRGRSRK